MSGDSLEIIAHYAGPIPLPYNLSRSGLPWVSELERGSAGAAGACSTGQSGSLARIHADDALSGLRKLESFLGSHEGVVRERIASAIELVIFIDVDERVPTGRKIRQVVAVRGFDLARYDYELLHLQ